MTLYAAFIALSLAWGFRLLFGPPLWRAALIGVIGGVGAWFIGGGV